MDDQSSEFVRHTSCSECGSSDANAVYSDLHEHCFSCGVTKQADGELSPSPWADQVSNVGNLAALGSPSALPRRRLTEETCQKFGYTVSEYNGQTVQIANYKVGGKVVAQKIRFPNKDFRFIGDTKRAGLYGMHLWKEGGKMLTIVEGEIDCLSAAQAMGLRWPVVSVNCGSQGAAKAIRDNYEYVISFDKVIVLMDQDNAGASATQSICEVLPPNKAFVASLPLKDASEMLKAGRNKELVDAIWQAKAFRPDGIIDASTMFDDVMSEDNTASIPYPWDGINDKLHGIRRGELVVLTAGTGVGKSSVIREISYDLLRQGETVGMIMLEENTRRTALGMMALHINKPIHISRENVTDDEMKTAFDATCGTGRLFLYDHWGSTDADNLISKVQYLAQGCGCTHLILDHISIAVSALEGDQRLIIDKMMTQLRSVVEATGVALFVISHLKRPEGKGHENGAETNLSQLRGSAALGQIADQVLGFERDQQSKEHADFMSVRVLKNRFSGDTGLCETLFYSKETGRLKAIDPEAVDDFADAEY